MADIRWQKPPRPWEIEAGDAGPDGALLRIGDKRYAVREIVGLRPSRISEPNVNGHLLAIGLFLLIGAIFVLPVVLQLVEKKFLFGGVLFLGIGATAILEVVKGQRMELYRLEIDLASGALAQFSTPDADECWALIQALERQG